MIFTWLIYETDLIHIFLSIGSSHKNVPNTTRLSPESSTAKESGHSEADSSSTISGNQGSQSSTTTSSTTSKPPKPMSQISGVRRDLSRCDSVAADVIYLPKYGVRTDRETELGEVLLQMMPRYRSHYSKVS